MEKTQLRRDLVSDLFGEVCRCGGAKLSKNTFCRGCYFSLTPDQRKALFRRAGGGYEEAYDEAVAKLKLIGRVK